MTEYERPNTVSGLVAKHKELTALREEYQRAIKKLSVDIEHLAACIRLFDPTAEDHAVKGHIARRRAKKGSVKQFVLSTLREASAPMSTIELAKLWAEARGLRTDETIMSALRKQVSMCVRNCATQGLVEADGMANDIGALGPCKLWKIKRSG
jgi:hypothetical protein